MKWNTIISVLLLVLVDFIGQAIGGADHCDNGHICPSPQKCCQAACCLPDGYEHHYKTFRWSVWNMWYFWFVMIFVLMSCFGGCGYWRRRQLLLAQQHHAMLHSAGYNDLFSRRLRSLRSAAVAHAHHRHHSEYIPVPLYAGFDSPYPPISNFPRSMAPVNRGPPEGMFPQPPPYSEVAKEGEFSSYPPQYKDDNLPPYPGDSYLTMDHCIGATNDLSGMGEQVPGLPPYSLTTNHSTAAAFAASQNSRISECSGRAHSSPHPATDRVSHSANPCSSYSIASSSQEPCSNTQNIPEIDTDHSRNISTDSNTERNSEPFETLHDTHRTIPP